MKERNLAIIITIILAIIGLFIGLITSIVYIAVLSGESFTIYNKFNFYKSQLVINGTDIKETLNFQTDQPYHSLFRTFQSTITTKDNSYIKNSISVDSVKCQSGDPYFKINNVCYQNPDFKNPVSCPAYTENNEYGCTFGDYYGFDQGQDYQISSEFTLNPENLIEINGKYYVKFIAYGRDAHISLIMNNNLFISGNAVYTNSYPSDKYVIIYIPYTGDIIGYNIQKQTDFEYDTPTNKKPNQLIFILLVIGIMLAHLLPAILFFLSWFFFGKELKEEDVPDQLSQNPTDRKAWEVAAFFNPPFGKIDKDFFSTMLLDFYRRKIIDLKLVKGFLKQDLMIKINDKSNKTLDNIEKQFLDILSTLKDLCSKKNMDGDYFNLNKSGNSYVAAFSLRMKYMDFQKALDKESKNYLENKGIIFFIISMIVLGFISFPLMIYGLFVLCILSIFIISIIASTTSLLIRYKSDFYVEYQEWQSFKKWLKGSPAMRKTGSKGVILWDKYLVYATALGVSKQVLKELKKQGLIDDRSYNFYSGVYIASSSFATSSGGGGHGGGFGGAGGGGVGGGGGGGR